MQIDPIFGTQQAYYAENTISGKRNNENEKNSPLSWQPDNVNISDEARAAYAALQKAQEEAKAEQGPGADEEFAEYMKEAKGEKPMPFDPAEQIEKLKEKMEKLNSQLAEVAQSSLPEDAKQAQTGAINAQISAINAQISELMEFLGGEEEA